MGRPGRWVQAQSSCLPSFDPRQAVPEDLRNGFHRTLSHDRLLGSRLEFVPDVLCKDTSARNGVSAWTSSISFGRWILVPGCTAAGASSAPEPETMSAALPW